MRRRSTARSEPVPPELAAFDLATWLPLVAEEPPPDNPDPELWRDIAAQRLWGKARGRWAEEHDGLGDFLDRLREELATRRGLYRRRQ